MNSTPFVRQYGILLTNGVLFTPGFRSFFVRVFLAQCERASQK